MSILSLLLYGSHARGDQDENSDIDLFAISNDNNYNAKDFGKANIACYPFELALKRAKNGDLFMLHICTQGKTIYKTGDEIDIIKSTFKYKENYLQEILHAKDLAWFLALNSEELKDYEPFNKRVSWCIRTILIAKSANMRRPLFSTKELCALSGISLTKDLIDLKNFTTQKKSTSDNLIYFLENYFHQTPNSEEKLDLDTYLRKFKENGNKMGLKVIKEIRKEANSQEIDYNSN